MNWTAKDEQRRRVLEGELIALNAKRVAAMSALEAALDDSCDDGGRLSAESAIRNADKLRDALAPFDSGIRAQEDA